jgi:hypothetical protein
MTRDELIAWQRREQSPIEKALRQAFNLGQTYWSQADSESYAQNKRSDVTRDKFETLVTETVAAALSQKEAAPSEEWLPIATAPKDGSVLWTFNGEQGRMHWTEGEINGEKWALWVWDDQLLADVDSEPDQPTHWRPLPAPPMAPPQAPEGGGL